MDWSGEEDRRRMKEAENEENGKASEGWNGSHIGFGL